MSITKDFLTGLGISAEVAEKIFAERGKEISETNTKINDLTSQLSTANETVSVLTKEKDELGKVAGSVDDYKAKIAEFEREAAERADKDAKAKAENLLNSKIDAILSGKEFVNDYVRNGVISDIKSKFAEDNTVGLNEIFNQITKDKLGIFKNPNDPALIPEANLPTGNVLSGVEKAFLERNPHIKL